MIEAGAGRAPAIPPRRRIIKLSSALVFVCLLLLAPEPARAWHDHTHLAIAKAAGDPGWYNAAAADVTKIKAGAIEDKNHFFDNDKNVEVTPRLVLDQAGRYNDPGDEQGHLYGAIIASLRAYRAAKEAGRYADYHLAFAAHYLGDLSQPLHNIAYDGFNRAHHAANDGLVERDVLDRVADIQKRMYEIRLRPDHFEEDLAREIARIANLSRLLGLKLKSERRDMTPEEAYTQLAHSASLLRAVINNLPDR
ncbi:MAG TPA: hypothetical protein VLY45_02870 [Nitrospiria bacterium]|nr:hypothetical protein [Nitrospiria bacterium]